MYFLEDIYFYIFCDELFENYTVEEKAVFMYYKKC